MNEEIRKLIQQEIAKVKEDLLVAPPGIDDPGYYSFKNRPSRPDQDCEQCAREPHRTEPCDHDHDKKYVKRLTCSACGGPLVMEGGCGCEASSYETLFDPMMGYNMSDMSDGMMVLSADDDHHEGAYMAKSQLHKIEKYASKIQMMIPEGHDLEDWMRTKISQAADDLGEVYHKLEYQTHSDH